MIIYIYISKEQKPWWNVVDSFRGPRNLGRGLGGLRFQGPKRQTLSSQMWLQPCNMGLKLGHTKSCGAKTSCK